MKTFDDYLNEDRLYTAAVLIHERKFPLVGLVNWYFSEGYNLSEDELALVLEGFWDEANSFWGDTWRGAAKGAGVGAGAGAGAAAGGVFGNLPGAAGGAGIGGLLGGIGGGLYGMGKHLWHRLRGKKEEPKAPEDTATVLRKIATDHPELGLNADELIAKLGKPAAVSPAEPPRKELTPEEEEWMNVVHNGSGGGK